MPVSKISNDVHWISPLMSNLRRAEGLHSRNCDDCLTCRGVLEQDAESLLAGRLFCERRWDGSKRRRISLLVTVLLKADFTHWRALHHLKGVSPRQFHTDQLH